MAYNDNGIDHSIKAFLSAFGLILQNSNGEKSYIYARVDGKLEQVGFFRIDALYNRGNRYYTDGYLHAEIGGGVLNAQIKANRISNSGDLIGINRIHFEFLVNSEKISEGEMAIKRHHKGHCLYEIKMGCSNPKTKKKVKLALNHKRELFNAKVIDNDNIERIIMNFSKSNGNSIIHENGSFACSDKVEECPLYKKTAIENLGNDGRLIKVWKIRQESIGGKIRRKKECVTAKKQESLIGLKGKEVLNRQMFFAGKFLYEVDTTIGNSIQGLINKTFVVNGIPVIKNFFSMCYMDYGVRPIDALFGILIDKSFEQFRYDESGEYPSIGENDRRARR